MRSPVLALLLCAFASVAQAEAVERFRTFLKTTQSARADFEQKVYGRENRLLQESKGSFVFQRPGRFRWTYAKPVDQVIVGDGERVWIHDRDLNQVTVRKMSKALGSTPAALLAGSSDVEKAFALSEAGTRDGLEWLGGEARRPGGGVRWPPARGAGRRVRGRWRGVPRPRGGPGGRAGGGGRRARAPGRPVPPPATP